MESFNRLVDNILNLYRFVSQLPFGTVVSYVFISSVTVLLLIVALSALRTPSFDYRGKHVLVTGGSSGIGLEAAKEYARLGADVTIVARDMKKLATAADILYPIVNKHGRKVVVISLDTGVGQEQVTAALKNIPPVDVLLNCAGTSVAGAFDDLDASEFERMMRVNLLGSVYPTRAVLAGMKRNCSNSNSNSKSSGGGGGLGGGGGGGRIVFVASQVAQAAIHGYTAYAASKWALRGLAEALQMEVKPFGILVSVCYPPDTDTPGYKVRRNNNRNNNRKE